MIRLVQKDAHNPQSMANELDASVYSVKTINGNPEFVVPRPNVKIVTMPAGLPVSLFVSVPGVPIDSVNSLPVQLKRCSPADYVSTLTTEVQSQGNRRFRTVYVV